MGEGVVVGGWVWGGRTAMKFILNKRFLKKNERVRVGWHEIPFSQASAFLKLMPTCCAYLLMSLFQRCILCHAVLSQTAVTNQMVFTSTIKLTLKKRPQVWLTASPGLQEAAPTEHCSPPQTSTQHLQGWGSEISAARQGALQENLQESTYGQRRPNGTNEEV